MAKATMTKGEFANKVWRAIGLSRQDMPRLYARLEELSVKFAHIQMARTQGKQPDSTLYLEISVNEPQNPKIVIRHLQLNEELEVVKDERVELGLRLAGRGTDPRQDTGYFDD